MHVYVTSATGALRTDAAPVGGGVAVLEALLPHLCAAPDLRVTLLCPRGGTGPATGDVVELDVPSLRDRPAESLLHLPERAYARFALEWEQALLDHLSTVTPERAVVLSNDVSEGPPFAELARRGFAQAVLYHVVVAEFFARQYLRGPLGSGLPAAALARLWRAGERLALTGLAPRIARLVWAKESEAARHAHAIVPSASLARSLARLYPRSGVAERTLVCPWGVIGVPDPARRARREETLAALGVPAGRFVLLTLSRISREKRLELLLRALRRIEERAPAAADRLALVVAGAPAYMGGLAYERRVRAESARLARVPVTFAGYVSGDPKWNLFAAADLFCSTSSYEAYGLTIAQALASGTPVLATDHEGARAILDEGGAAEAGSVVGAHPRDVARGILTALDVSDRRDTAARWGVAHLFDDAASAVVAALRGIQVRSLDGPAHPRRGTDALFALPRI